MVGIRYTFKKRSNTSEEGRREGKKHSGEKVERGQWKLIFPTAFSITMTPTRASLGNCFSQPWTSCSRMSHHSRGPEHTQLTFPGPFWPRRMSWSPCSLKLEGPPGPQSTIRMGLGSRTQGLINSSWAKLNQQLKIKALCPTSWTESGGGLLIHAEPHLHQLSPIQLQKGEKDQSSPLGWLHKGHLLHSIELVSQFSFHQIVLPRGVLEPLCDRPFYLRPQASYFYYLLLNSKHSSKHHDVPYGKERELRPGFIIPALQVKALVLSPGCTLEAPESPEELHKLLTHQGWKSTTGDSNCLHGWESLGQSDELKQSRWRQLNPQTGRVWGTDLVPLTELQRTSAVV